jgi:hypothetical protein
MDHTPLTYDGPRVLLLRQRARTVNALLTERFETLLALCAMVPVRWGCDRNGVFGLLMWA